MKKSIDSDRSILESPPMPCEIITKGVSPPFPGNGHKHGVQRSHIINSRHGAGSQPGEDIGAAYVTCPIVIFMTTAQWESQLYGRLAAEVGGSKDAVDGFRLKQSISVR